MELSCDAIVNTGESLQATLDDLSIGDGDTICLAPGVDTGGLSTTKELTFVRIGTGPITVGPSRIYWTDAGTHKIQQADLDGSNVESLVTGLSAPTDIAVDAAGDKIYWTDDQTDKIQRANLDGSNVEDLVTSGMAIPAGIALGN